MKSLSEIYDSIDNPLNNRDSLRKATMESLKTYYSGSGEGLYDRLVKFNGREDKSPVNESDRDKFLIETTEEWRKKFVELYSRKSSDEIESDDKRDAIRYILSLSEITTIEQRNIVYKQLQSMEAKKLFWENHDGGWDHIMLNRISSDPSKNIVPKVTHRLYLSCKNSDLFKMMEILRKKCADAGLPYYFKTMVNEHRDDNIVIYSDTENLPNYLSVLDGISQEYPEIVGNFGKPPFLTGKYNGWIGFGDEPITEKGNGAQSYNEKRSDIMFDAILKTMEQEISELKGKTTLIDGKEISFNNASVSRFTDYYINNCINLSRNTSLRHMETVYGVTKEDLANRRMISDCIKKNMTSILSDIFQCSDTSHNMMLSNGKKTAIKMEVAREALSSLVPLVEKFDPTFLDKVRLNIEKSAEEKGIDIDKFCFETGTKEKYEEEDRRRAEKQKESSTEEVIEEKKESKIRKGPVQVYDENGNIIIQDFINPTLLERKIKLPNGYEMSAKQYIQENFAPHIPESGTFKLKNGNEISARQYIEEFIMFELEKYDGDLDAMMQDTLAGTDEPPARDGWTQPTHGQEMGISEEQTETLSSTPRVSLDSFKKVIATKRDRERVGLSEVKESQDEIALRQERGKLVSLSMRGQLDEDGKRRLEEINSMLGIQRQQQRSTNKGQKNGQNTSQGR